MIGWRLMVALLGCVVGSVMLPLRQPKVVKDSRNCCKMSPK